MRITLVTAHFPPRLSGHADFSGLLAHALAERGLDVNVVVLGQDQVVESGDCAVKSGPLPRGLRSLRGAVDSIESTSPDVVLLQFEAHAFDLRWAPHLLPAALRRRGHRVVMTYHELWKPGRFGALPKAMLLNSAHRVITFSHWHAAGVRRFRRFGTPPDIVACGSNIVKPVVSDRRLLRARYGIEASTVLFTFFGFVMREHRVLELLEALAAVRTTGIDARLQVIGRFDPTIDGYHQQLVAKARQLGLGEAVTWHGRVEDDQAVARLIAISDAGVLPYDTGVGENNGAFSAFAHHGIATVTTRGERSGLMEELEVAVFTTPDVGGLTEAMLCVARDDQQRELVAKRAADWAQRRSWDVVGQAYERLLTSDPAPLEVL